MKKKCSCPEDILVGIVSRSLFVKDYSGVRNQTSLVITIQVDFKSDAIIIPVTLTNDNAQ